MLPLRPLAWTGHDAGPGHLGVMETLCLWNERVLRQSLIPVSMQCHVVEEPDRGSVPFRNENGGFRISAVAPVILRSPGRCV